MPAGCSVGLVGNLEEGVGRPWWPILRGVPGSHGGRLQLRARYSHLSKDDAPLPPTPSVLALTCQLCGS